MVWKIRIEYTKVLNYIYIYERRVLRNEKKPRYINLNVSIAELEFSYNIFPVLLFSKPSSKISGIIVMFLDRLPIKIVQPVQTILILI